MTQQTNSPFLLRDDNRKVDRREERYEALLLHSWMQMRARTPTRDKADA